ncbi:FHA domain-containing protein [candidate division KSB1 bacterium]|nr:FHA domain-containing protein [candidate division KSB1 bacterium]
MIPGADWIEANGVTSTTVNNSPPEPLKHSQPATAAAFSNRNNTSGVEPVLQLVHLETGKVIDFAENDEMVIGRKDVKNGIVPDLDTTVFGGRVDGVSRQHARILRAGLKYYLQDLNSVNATFINEKQLTPFIFVPLRDGDEIRLGKLKFKVRFN